MGSRLDDRIREEIDHQSIQILRGERRIQEIIEDHPACSHFDAMILVEHRGRSIATRIREAGCGSCRDLNAVGGHVQLP